MRVSVRRGEDEGGVGYVGEFTDPLDTLDLFPSYDIWAGGSGGCSSITEEVTGSVAVGVVG